MTITNTIMPKSGCMCPICGLVMGWCQTSGQLHPPIKYTPHWPPNSVNKQSSSSEGIFINTRQNALSITFKENLEISVNCTNEHDKVGFIAVLKEQVTFYGPNNMFLILDSNNVMHILVQNCYLFDL